VVSVAFPPFLGDCPMSEFLMSFIPAPSNLAEPPPVLQQEAVVPGKPEPPPNPEQLQAVDSVFVHDHEKLTALSVYALWSWAMMIGDMAREHLRRAAEDTDEDEEEEHPRLPDKDRDL